MIVKASGMDMASKTNSHDDEKIELTLAISKEVEEAGSVNIFFIFFFKTTFMLLLYCYLLNFSINRKTKIAKKNKPIKELKTSCGKTLKKFVKI